MMQDEDKSLPIDRKYALTIKEASEYFGIGINKLYEIANDPYNEAIYGSGIITN